MGDKKNAYKILIGAPEGKRLRGRPRYRWEDNETVLEENSGMVWIGFICARVGVNSVMNVRVHKRRGMAW